MWELRSPQAIKLIVGLLGTNEQALTQAVSLLETAFGPTDLASDIWPFDYTRYYHQEMGDNQFRQFVSFQNLVLPDALAQIKHQTNDLERQLAETLPTDLPRPVNLDPGLIETSKLVLASTKNFAHRIYVGNKIWAEVTLIYDKGAWTPLLYTYPDYRQAIYWEFFSRVRERLREQHREEVQT